TIVSIVRATRGAKREANFIRAPPYRQIESYSKGRVFSCRQWDHIRSSFMHGRTRRPLGPVIRPTMVTRFEPIDSRAIERRLPADESNAPFSAARGRILWRDRPR